MGFFTFGKNKKKGCACENNASFEIPTMSKPQENLTATEGIIVLGMGCAKCKTLTEIANKALENMGINSQVEHITDLSAIAAYGITSTPALVIDGKVVSSGKVLKIEEVISLIKEIRG